MVSESWGRLRKDRVETQGCWSRIRARRIIGQFGWGCSRVQLGQCSRASLHSRLRRLPLYIITDEYKK